MSLPLLPASAAATPNDIGSTFDTLDSPMLQYLQQFDDRWLHAMDLAERMRKHVKELHGKAPPSLKFVGDVASILDISLDHTITESARLTFDGSETPQHKSFINQFFVKLKSFDKNTHTRVVTISMQAGRRGIDFEGEN